MKKIIIEKKNLGKRIDKFLASASSETLADQQEFFSFSRGEIIRQIKAGNILVGDKKVKPSYVLKEGDAIVVKRETGNVKRNDLIPNSKIKLEIIFKNKDIIAVNKPAGIQVHPDFHEKNNTLANALVAKFPEIENVGEDLTRPGIVHRLDKDTSGVMVVARNQKTFEELKRKFKNREMEKKYWAAVNGKMEKAEGVIDKPLAKASNYKKQIIAHKKTKTTVRAAVTHYKVLKQKENWSLLEVMPKTGRTHQIRVHLTSISHPIVGDKTYKLKNQESLKCQRQLLHAFGLSFELYGQKYDFKAELPEDFKQFISNID